MPQPPYPLQQCVSLRVWIPCCRPRLRAVWQDADVSTPAKCKKILRDEGVAFAPDASHPRLALLAQTAVRKKRKLNFVKESDFAEEIKVSTSLSVSEFVDLVQKVITQKDEKGYCVNVRCILNNITTPFTVLRCGRNKCPTIIKAGNSMCNKCYGAVNDAYTYTDFLFQLTLEAWDSSDQMDVTGVKKAGILYVPIRTLFFFLLLFLVCVFEMSRAQTENSFMFSIACR